MRSRPFQSIPLFNCGFSTARADACKECLLVAGYLREDTFWPKLAYYISLLILSMIFAIDSMFGSDASSITFTIGGPIRQTVVE